MKDTVDKCSNKGCAIDIGSVIDNTNCTTNITRHFDTAEAAASFFNEAEKLAKSVASEADKLAVKREIKNVDNGAELIAAFTFTNQAETIIFELSMRSLG